VLEYLCPCPVLTPGDGLGHMTVDTYRKQFLPTFHMAFKAKSNSTEVPRSSKESCSRNMVLRRL